MISFNIIRIKYLSYGMILILVLSCSGGLSEKDIVRGNWLIEEVVIDGYDVKNEMGIDAIFFKEDGSCRVPFIEAKNLQWTYMKDQSNGRKLVLENKKDDLEFQFEVVFSLMDNRLLQMELISEDLYVLSSKLLFNPQNHPDFVRELLEPMERDSKLKQRGS